MTNREVSVTLLCEDLQQEVFMRQWLQVLGFKTRKIRVIRAPGGFGAGEQFVKEHYASEVRAQRAQSTYRNVSLVVIIDADALSIAERKSQLAEQLQMAKQAMRSDKENIALMIPKRNIETWIYHMDGKGVDEVTAYTKLANESDCKQAVLQYVRSYQPQTQLSNAPHSLEAGWQEMKRIQQ